MILGSARHGPSASAFARRWGDPQASLASRAKQGCPGSDSRRRKGDRRCAGQSASVPHLNFDERRDPCVTSNVGFPGRRPTRSDGVRKKPRVGGRWCLFAPYRPASDCV